MSRTRKSLAIAVHRAQDPGLAALQHLIDRGIWSLEGSMGRQMMRAIEGEGAMLGDERARDYWGNTIPSWRDVQPGTKGSPEYAADILGI